MAKMLQGILGAVSGKVGGVVAASWKDKIYVRGYSIPANPNTEAQQAQRSSFARCVNFAKLLIGQVFNVYTDRFLKNMSGFNYFISRNIAHFAIPLAYNLVKITEGKLSYPSVNLPSTSYGDGVLTIGFNPNLGNNGANTDKVFGCAYNEATGVMAFPAGEVTRESGSIEIPIFASVGQPLYFWIFAIKYNGTVPEIISDSVFDTIDA